MKRILVALVMFTFFIPQNLLAEEVEIDGIRYILNNDGTAEVGEQYWRFLEGDNLCITIPSTICYENNTYTVTKIGYNAFSHSWGVLRFELPETITSIGSYAFAECGNLESITFPEGLLSLGEYVFLSCKKLKSIDLPQSLLSIGEGCFISCTNLESIKMHEGITEISPWCFYLCVNLSEIDLPESILSIGEYAFSQLRINKFVIPKNVVRIEAGAFACFNLIRLYVYATSPPMLEGENIFPGVPLHRGRLFVPAGSEEAYREAEGWGDWWKILPIEDEPDGIEQAELSDYAPSAIYGMNGTRLDNPQRGINIIRDKEGKTKKVIR